IDPEPGDPGWLEFLLVSHIRLVISTQLERRVPDDLAHLDAYGAESALKTWGTDGRWAGLESVRTGVDSLYSSDAGFLSIRDQDCARWREGLLPLLASRLFCGPELSEGLLNLWLEVVEPPRRGLIVDRLAETAFQHLQLDLAEADIELLSRIDPGRAT